MSPIDEIRRCRDEAARGKSLADARTERTLNEVLDILGCPRHPGGGQVAS